MILNGLVTITTIMKLKIHLLAAAFAICFSANAQESKNESAARKWIADHAK